MTAAEELRAASLKAIHAQIRTCKAQHAHTDQLFAEWRQLPREQSASRASRIDDEARAILGSQP